MYSKLAIASALLAAPAALANDPHEPTNCSDVRIFTARGWNEDYPGRHIYLVDAICADLPGMTCDYEDVIYDAWSTEYCPNVIEGEAAGLAQINAYYAKCPNSKIVVSGYSEGATIMEDILAGGGGVNSTCGETFLPLSTVSGASCNIAAAITFGNPRHNPNRPYNYLNGSAGEASDYRREASQLAILDYYQPRYRSYCNYDDLICAPGLGADLVSAHTNYFDEYSTEAGAWIAGLVKDFSFGQYCPISNTTSSTSSAVSATATASTSSIKTYSNSTASATKSIAVVTVTDVTSVYTTVCPQTSKITTGGSVVTSVWTGPSAATTTINSTITATVSVTAVATLATSKPALLTTTVSGKSAVVSCTVSVSTTTYANFPTLSISKTVPVATSVIGGGSWVRANGTVTGAASGTGAASWSTSTGAVPYTGAANGLKAAGSLAGVAGLVAMFL